VELCTRRFRGNARPAVDDPGAVHNVAGRYRTFTTDMGSLPRGDLGVGSATNGVSIQVGGALGVAIIGSLLSTRYQDQMTTALARTICRTRSRTASSARSAALSASRPG
jgi:hypothetical protein